MILYTYHWASIYMKGDVVKKVWFLVVEMLQL